MACRDVKRMATLFRALAWPETPASDEYHLTFQCTNGVVVGLYAAHHYEPHFGLPSSGFRCVTLGVNLGSFDKCLEVNEALRRVHSSLKDWRPRDGLPRPSRRVLRTRKRQGMPCR